MAKKKSKPVKKKSKKSGILRKIFRIIKISIIVFIIASVVSTILFRFVNPPITLTMIFRYFESRPDGSVAKIDKQWVPIDSISQNMIQAIVTSEDQNFLNHWGFDFGAIQKVYEMNQSKKKHGLRGGSTITQQTAKNVFLNQSRTWVRKGFEVYFTSLIQVFWSKKRTMEVYLNIIEFGDGIYGIEAASQYYFHKSAKKLTKHDAAAIAAIVPNPRNWSPVKPSPIVAHKIQWIYNNMDKVEKVQFD